MLSLLGDPQYVGLAAFLGGLLVARIFAAGKSKAKENEATETDRRVRSLEADLRVAKKNLKNSEEKLASTQEELKAANGTLTDVQGSLDERTKELAETRESLQAECQKTNSLRVDLTGRAEETIRAEVHAREVETELSVLKAGATAVHDEVDRLAAERTELTGRLREIEDEFLAAEALEDDVSNEKSDLDEPLLDI